MKQEMMGWQWHHLDRVQIICTSALDDAQPTVSTGGTKQDSMR